MTVQEMIEEYMLFKAAEGLSEKSLEQYHFALKRFSMRVTARQLNELTPQMIDAYSKSLKPYKAGTKRNYMKPIYGMLDLACYRGYIKFDRGALARPRRGHVDREKGKIMNVNDFKAMLAVARQLADTGDWRHVRNLAMLMFTADTWCRLGGLIGLTLDALDLNSRTAQINEKGNVWREVTFTEPTARVIQRWLEVRPMPTSEHNVVWVSLRDYVVPMSPRTWQDVCNKLAEAAGVTGPHNPHSIRHMSATLASENGVAVEVIQEKCGHISPTTTIQYYLHTSKKRIDDATGKVAGALGLDDENQDQDSEEDRDDESGALALAS